MSAVSRRAAVQLLRPTTIRTLATTSIARQQTPSAGPAQTATSNKSARNDQPLPVGPTIFPAPIDPFDTTAGRRAGTAAASSQPAKKYSDTHVKMVKGVARLFGYNTRASTAIRETSRMMTGIVDAIEDDREFWYEQCRLPQTYQTFFQLHALYVLMLLPRLRSLPASMPTHRYPIPEPQTPSEPSHSAPTANPVPTPEEASLNQSVIADDLSSMPPRIPNGGIGGSAAARLNSVNGQSSEVPQEAQEEGSSSVSIFSKPDYQSYQAELVNHLFELAETQLRRILGRGERERVIKKYLQEYGEQFKGAYASLNFVLGLELRKSSNITTTTASQAAAGQSPTTTGASSPGEEDLELPPGDVELASFLWRNLFGSKGLGAPVPALIDTSDVSAYSYENTRTGELDMLNNLETVVKFVRREMHRLDQIDSIDVLNGNIGSFGRVEEGRQ